MAFTKSQKLPYLLYEGSVKAMNKPIYIICTPFFPTPTSWRGPFCYDFARAVERTGKYDVRVFVKGNGADYVYNGVKVFRFRFLRGPSNFGTIFINWLNQRLFWRAVKKAGISPSDVAIFHAHEISFSPLVKHLKKHNPAIKTLWHCHNMGQPFTLKCGRLGVIPGYATLWYLWLKKVFAAIDLPMFVSARQRSKMGRWYPTGYLGKDVDVRKGLWFGRLLGDIKLKPTKVLYNGIDYSVFNPEGRPSQRDTFVVGDVAIVDEVKDQLTLLKAVNRLKAVIPNLRCRLVGTGCYLETCRKYVTENGLGEIVEFIKEMDHLKLPDFYRSLDLFVSPSWAEGFCCTFMEAHGCGTPIIGCREVSVEEALPREDWDKWLFPRQDDAALARLIERYYHARDKQVLSRDFNIDTLVGTFIKDL